MKKFMSKFLKWFGFITVILLAVCVVITIIILGVWLLVNEHYALGGILYWLLLAVGGGIVMALED